MRWVGFVVGVVLGTGCGDSGTGGSGGSGDTGPEGSSTSDGTVRCFTESCSESECCLNSVCDTAQACDEYVDFGWTYFCDGPEDCSGGDTCCAGIPAGSFPIRSECTAPAECSMLPNALYFCHSDEDCGELGSCAPYPDTPYVSVCGQ